MMFRTIYLALALIFVAGLCNAGEVVYYDEDGKPVHKSKYIDLKQEREAQINKKNEQWLKELSSKKDQYGRPLYDSHGHKIHYIGASEPNAKAQKTPHKKAARKMEYDQYGRPMFDADGNMITYQYWVVFKNCEACGREIPLKTREGQPCPHCGAIWHWPKETKITKQGIKE